MKHVVIKKEIPIPRGFTGVCLEGHTVLYVDNTTGLPDEFDEKRDFIRDVLPGEESGEYTPNRYTGAAMINCDINGKPLSGFRVLREGIGKYSTGSLFKSGTYITVDVVRNGNEIHVDVSKSTVNLPNMVETLWQYNGLSDDLSIPYDMQKYLKPICAAFAKSMCPDCHCLHFYNGVGVIKW